MEIVLTFSNTNYSIKAEQALLAGGVRVAVMPLPSAIRAGCGLCLRVSPEALSASEALLHAAGVPVEGRYLRAQKNGVSQYEPYESGDLS